MTEVEQRSKKGSQHSKKQSWRTNSKVDDPNNLEEPKRPKTTSTDKKGVKSILHGILNNLGKGAKQNSAGKAIIDSKKSIKSITLGDDSEETSRKNEKMNDDKKSVKSIGFHPTTEVVDVKSPFEEAHRLNSASHKSVTISLQANPAIIAIEQTILESNAQIELLDSNKMDLLALLHVQRNRTVEKLRTRKPTDALYKELDNIDKNIDYVQRQYESKKKSLINSRKKAAILLQAHDNEEDIAEESEKLLEQIRSERVHALDLMVVKRAYVIQLLDLIAILQDKVDEMDRMVNLNRIKFEKKIRELNRIIYERAGMSGSTDSDHKKSIEELRDMKRAETVEFEEFIAKLILEKKSLIAESLLKRNEINEMMQLTDSDEEVEPTPVDVISVEHLNVPEHKISGSMQTRIGSTPPSSTTTRCSDYEELSESEPEEDDGRIERFELLKQMIGRPLIHALAEVIAKHPDSDPIHYLSQWFFSYSRYEKFRLIQEKEEFELREERNRLVRERLIAETKDSIWEKFVLALKARHDLNGFGFEEEERISLGSFKSGVQSIASKIRFNPVVDVLRTPK